MNMGEATTPHPAEGRNPYLEIAPDLFSLLDRYFVKAMRKTGKNFYNFTSIKIHSHESIYYVPVAGRIAPRSFKAESACRIIFCSNQYHPSISQSSSRNSSTTLLIGPRQLYPSLVYFSRISHSFSSSSLSNSTT